MKKLLILFGIFSLFFTQEAFAFDTSAECAYLINADTGEVLYEKNANTRHLIASTTKIMTAIVALENAQLSDIATVSQNAQNQEGSSVYLREGEKIEIKSLLYGMMLNSGNDAACVIAEHIGGDVETFAKMMTQKAVELGAKNSSFKNPNGLDEEGHYSTASDLAKITAYALKNEIFREIVSTKTAEINTGSSICYLKNQNKLLWNYDGCIGVKTGYTKAGGRSLVSAAVRDGITLIAVTLNAPDDWNDHKKMLDYGFSKTQKFFLIEKGQILKEFNNNTISFNMVAENEVTYSATGEMTNSFEVILHTIKNPTVNIDKGEKVGYAECLLGKKLIAQVDIVADRNVEILQTDEKRGFFDTVLKIFNLLLLK